VEQGIYSKDIRFTCSCRNSSDYLLRFQTCIQITNVRSCNDVYIYSVEIFIIVILMYPVLNLTHILNILDKFSMGVTKTLTIYLNNFER
jgi:hypothetical protein